MRGSLCPLGGCALLLGVAMAGVVPLGCSHDPWDGHVYHAGRMSFRAGTIPQTWNRLRIDGPLLAFHDTASDGSIEVYARCGIDADDVPLEWIGIDRPYTEADVRSMDEALALPDVVSV